MSSDSIDLAESQRRAGNTLATVKAGMESGKAPVVSQIVQVIRDLSGRAEQMSVAELAETISRDPTTLSRIIAIAGSLGYNPNGVEVTSIHQAIGLIGFDRIRTLAVSLLLVENSEQRNSAETNREISGVAFSSGLFAAEMCRRGIPIDPELAFLCSALRSYGRMLMVTFMGDDYAQAQELAKQGTTDLAFRRIFGLTPLELGRELLTSLSLPPIILSSLKSLPKDTIQQAELSPTASLISVAEFGLRVAEAIASPELTADNFDATIEAIGRDYGDKFKLSPESTKDIVQQVSVQLDGFTAKAGTSRDSVVLFRRLEAIATDRPLPPAYIPKQPVPVAISKTTSSDTASTSSQLAVRLLGAAADEFTRLLGTENPEPRQIFQLLIGTLQKALELNSCLIFIKEKNGPRFHLGYGAGPLFAECRAVVLDPSERKVFALPLKRGEDVSIQNPDDEKMRSFVPEWLRKPEKVLPFFLLPIKDENGSFALVCATSTSKESFALVSRFSAELRRIRAQISPLGRILTQCATGAGGAPSRAAA